MLKFLRCLNCRDIILLTLKAKRCECGGCLGAFTGKDEKGNNLYAYTGKASTFQLEEDSLDQQEGGKFIGFVSSNRMMTLGQKSEELDPPHLRIVVK